MRWRPLLIALAAGAVLFRAEGSLKAEEPAEKALPTYLIRAPQIEQTGDKIVHASGGVTVTSEGLEVTSDRVEANLDERRLTAEGNVTVVQDGATFRAPGRVEGNLLTNEWRAPGAFTVRRDDKFVQAEAAEYNTKQKTGILTNARGQYGIYYLSGRAVMLKPQEIVTATNARASTCNLPHPHWSVGADRIEVHDDSYAVAHGIGVWIGNTRLFSIPRYRFRLDETPGSQFLPTPGYDGRDGGYLRFNYPFSTPWTTASSLIGRLTQRNGVQGTLEMQRSLTNPKNSGAPESLAPDVVSDLMDVNLLSQRSSASSLSLRSKNARKVEDEAPPEPELRSHLYVRMGWKERVFDPSSRFLSLDRLPEVGVRVRDIPTGRISWKGSPVLLDVQGSYGRFRESNNRGFIGRSDLHATAHLTADIGKRWMLEPVLLARYSGYSTGDQQAILAGSLAIGRQITPRYFGAVTYIRHAVGGHSPLEFDDVDVREKLATRLEGQFGRTWASLTLDFDLQTGGLYDWTIQFAKRMHCYEPRFGYQNRYRSFSIGLAFTLPT